MTTYLCDRGVTIDHIETLHHMRYFPGFMEFLGADAIDYFGVEIHSQYECPNCASAYEAVCKFFDPGFLENPRFQ